MIEEQIKFVEDLSGLEAAAVGLEALGGKASKVMDEAEKNIIAAGKAVAQLNKELSNGVKKGAEEAKKSLSVYDQGLVGLTSTLRKAKADAGQFGAAQKEVAVAVKAHKSAIESQRSALLQLEKAYVKVGKNGGEAAKELSNQINALRSSIKSNEDQVGLLQLEYLGLRDAQKKTITEGVKLGKNLLGVTSRLKQVNADAGSFAAAQKEVGEEAKRLSENIEKQRKALLQLEKSFSSLGDSGSAAGKKLSTEIDTLRTTIKGNEDQVGLLALEYIGLGDAQKKAAKEAGSLRKPIRLSANEATNLSFQLNDVFTSIGQGSGVLRTLVQQGPQISQIFGGVGNTFRFMGQQALASVKSVLTLRGAFQLLGKVGILLLITAVAGALSELNKRTKFLTDATAGLSKAFGVVLDRLTKFGTGLLSILSGDFTKGFNEIAGSVDGLGSAIVQAAEDGFNLSRSIRGIKKDLEDLAVVRAAQKEQLVELEALAGDSEVSAKKRIQAQTQLTKLQTDNLDKNLAAQRSLLLGAVTNTTDVTEAGLKKLQQLREGASEIRDANGKLLTEDARAELSEQATDYFNYLAERESLTISNETAIRGIRRESTERYLEQLEKRRKLEEAYAKSRQTVAEKLQKLQEEGFTGEAAIERDRRVALAEIANLEEVTRKTFKEAGKRFDLQEAFAQLRLEVNGKADREIIDERFKTSRELIEQTWKRAELEVAQLTISAEEQLTLEEYKAAETARIQRESFKKLRAIAVKEYGPDSIEVFEIDAQIAESEEAAVNVTVESAQRRRDALLAEASLRKDIEQDKVNLLTVSGDKELSLANFVKREKLAVELEFLKKKTAILATDPNSTEAQREQLRIQVANIEKAIDDIDKIKLSPLDKIKDKLAEALNLDQKQLAELGKVIGGIFSDISDGIAANIDRQITEYDRLIDELSDQIGETEDLLEEQLSLREQGLANDASVLEQRLAEENALRDEALEEKAELEKKAAKQQLIVDAATQASALAVAAAQIFAANAGVPLVGVAIAAAAVASMFSLYAKFKATAAKAEVPTFEKGGRLVDGYIIGPSHADGGVTLRDRQGAFYEIQGQEFVTSAVQTSKYLPALESINSGAMDGLSNAAALRLLGKSVTLPKTSAPVDGGRKSDDFDYGRMEAAMDKAAGRMVRALEGRPVEITLPDGSRAVGTFTGTKKKRTILKGA